MQRHNTENLKQIFPEKKLLGYSPNFHIHVSVRDLYIPICICLFCCRKCVNRSWDILIAHRHMDVETVTEAAQFLEKEYINGTFVAVHLTC
jgi:hypothetical protein